jgi:hypothetical protein
LVSTLDGLAGALGLRTGDLLDDPVKAADAVTTGEA